MKKIKFLILLLCGSFVAISQPNQGIVNYKTISIDTINNVITVQDSVYTKFVFKPNKIKWETGFVNRPIGLKTILNQQDFYVIIDDNDSKTASHGEMENQNVYDQLLNYKDTSLSIICTNIIKSIAGRNCKKLILKFKISDSPTLVLWYDDTINCESIIPGAGVNGKSIKGLILEYEIPNVIGKIIVTADTVSFGNVSNTLFNPNLSGYTITEIERENGAKCSGNH